MSNYNSKLSNKSYNRSNIPKDLWNNFEGKDEFRLSLRYVYKLRHKSSMFQLCLISKNVKKGEASIEFDN